MSTSGTHLFIPIEDLFFTRLFPEIMLNDGTKLYEVSSVPIIPEERLMSVISVPPIIFIPFPHGVIMFNPVFEYELSLISVIDEPVEKIEFS